MNREFYCGFLKDKGDNALQAENGEDTLEILKGTTVDVILFDAAYST